MGYILVNPNLGNSSIESNKKNSTVAANDIWSQLSVNIKNYTPKFYFTIQESGGSKLSHFIIEESLENDRVKYNLKQFRGKKIDEKSFLKELAQEGGKRHRHHSSDISSSSYSSSSSSSSSSELIFSFPSKNSSYPNFTYYPTIYGVPNVILPTFLTTFTPYTNIKLLPNILIVTP